MKFVIPSKQPKKTDKIALIDSDYIMYKITSRIEEKTDIGFYTEQIEVEINTLKELFKAKNMLFCFSGNPDDYYRSHICFDKKYKGTRERSLTVYREVTFDYISNRYASLRFDELEADDLLSMLQDKDTFIYSEDKDMKQIPGTHWDLKKECFYDIDEVDAFEFLIKQVLIGDTVDNITGLKNCGEAKSYKILNENTLPSYQAVFNAYIYQHGIENGIDAFVEAWNLVKLRTKKGDYFIEKYQLAFNTLKLLKNE